MKNEGNMGIYEGNHKLFTQHFVEDQIALAEDKMDIEYMLHKFHNE